MMDRRQALAALASGSIATLAAADIEAAPKHWLDSWSSQDIERVLRDIGAWPKFKNRMTAERRKVSQRARRESRGADVVVYRGPVTDPLPQLFNVRQVRASRRDVLVTEISLDDVSWAGHDLPRGSRILIDSRARLDDLGGLLCEIIDTNGRGRRMHIWRGPTGRVALALRERASAWADAVALEERYG